MGAYEFVPVVLAPKSLGFGLQSVGSTINKTFKGSLAGMGRSAERSFSCLQATSTPEPTQPRCGLQWRRKLDSRALRGQRNRRTYPDRSEVLRPDMAYLRGDSFHFRNVGISSSISRST